MSTAAMSGPDHFREAEDLLAIADQPGLNGVANLIAAAQVHATLALAAVTAELASHAPPPSQRTYPRTGWDELLQPHHPASGEEPF